MKIQWAVLAAVMAVGSAVPAYSSEIMVLGGLNFEKTAISPTTNTLSSKSAFAVGALFGTELVPWFLGIETGLMYVNRNSGGAQPIGQVFPGLEAGELLLSRHAAEIPLVVRFKFLPFIKPGVGVFYSWSVGSKSLSVPIGGVTELTKSTDDQKDYGLVASVQAKLPVLPILDLVGDVRYNYGLKSNTYDATNTMKLRELQFFVGASLSLIVI